MRPLAIGFLLCPMLASPVFAAPMDWKPIPIGGGGYTVGIVIHPLDDNIKYCRTDVSGAYKWNEASEKWEQILSGDRLPPQARGYETFNGATALAVHPTETQTVFASFGYRPATLLVSRDGGKKWRYLNFQTQFHDKKDRGLRLRSDFDRMHGERLAVDPKNPNVVYFGTFLNGLVRCLDVSKTENSVWETLTSGDQPKNEKDENDNPTASLTAKDTVPKIVFDPTSPEIEGRSARIYAMVWRKGVFRSEDGGKTWLNMCGVPGGPPSDKYWHDLEVTPSGVVYLLAGQEKTPTHKDGSCLWKFEDGTWTDITPANQRTRNQTEIVIDPKDEKRILVFEADGRSRRVFEGAQNPNSFGWGESGGFTLRAKDVPWLEWVKPVWSTGSAQFDSKGTLWMGEGTGIWRTDDAFKGDPKSQKYTLNWESVTAAQESFMPRAFVAIPGKDQLSMGVLDKIGVTSTDFSKYPSQTWDKDNHSDTHSLDYPGDNPLFQVKMTKRWNWDLNDYSGTSTDGGLTWKRFGAVLNGKLPAELTWGDIAVSAKNTNLMIWASRTTGRAGITRDGGETFSLLDFSKVGLDPKWSTDKLSFGWDVWHTPLFLGADRVRDGVFYLYQQRDGQDDAGRPRPTLLRTQDGGTSWRAFDSLPTGSYHGKMETVPGQANHFFFAYGADLDGGLFFSKDGGETAQKVGDFSRASCVGFGKAAPGQNYPAIYTQARRGKEDWGVWRSLDGAKSWEKIADYPLGIEQNIQAITGDMARYGRVYVAFAAYGAAYADLK